MIEADSAVLSSPISQSPLLRIISAPGFARHRDATVQVLESQRLSSPLSLPLLPPIIAVRHISPIMPARIDDEVGETIPAMTAHVSKCSEQHHNLGD